jgi:hypothetical protein
MTIAGYQTAAMIDFDKFAIAIGPASLDDNTVC